MDLGLFSVFIDYCTLPGSHLLNLWFINNDYIAQTAVNQQTAVLLAGRQFCYVKRVCPACTGISAELSLRCRLSLGERGSNKMKNS